MNTIFISDRNRQPRRLVCYLGTWTNYRTYQPFKIEDIDTDKCTHIVYGFSKLDERSKKLVMFDPWLDDDLSENCKFINYKLS